MIDWIYDIETYPNIFTIGLESVETGNRHLFEISWRRNQLPELIQFLTMLKMNGDRMVGFNNIGFDYPVIHFIIENQHRINVTDIYNKAMSIINAPFNNRFAHIIWERDRHVDQLDLFKIHHFDNKARYTSLKVLEFNMKMDNIEDLPYAPGSLLNWQQCDTLIDYMWHDIKATRLFYDETLKQIAFREDLTKKYERDFINHNDTKIGKDYFIMELERLVPGFDKKRQTPRDYIRVSDILFDYISFEQPEFQRIHEWFKQQVITDTKGAFKDIHCSVHGFQFDFGTGGIHGSIDSQIIEADDENCIIDIDVASYYPNLAIANGLHPEHLGEMFCKIYKDVYEQRKTFAKGTTENAMLKLALNGVYGDSNSEYSPFYDPQYTMSITINGQLLLCMLAEKLMASSQVELLQINTDGLTIRCPRTLIAWVKATMSWWENLSGLELEDVEYSRMFIRDVNNYIAEKTDGGLKRKGAYDYDLGWHQNHSALVVPKAAEAALVRGEDIRTFIENHQDPYDFMLRTKVPRSSRLVAVDYQGVDHPQQNVSRYYISVMGHDLVKVMPPLKGKVEDRRIGIHTSWKVTMCNDVSQFNMDEVEFDWYVKEAEKLVNPLRRI